MSSALRPAALGLQAYISGKSLMAMLQLLHVPMYIGVLTCMYACMCTYITYIKLLLAAVVINMYSITKEAT